ncbi:MAG: T9SS type A sorting domain-containing protein [Verrucomicrobia bacterium]|nr:T9SS type A sorting domain-containing protein [Cytophagales bacterium]
MEFLLSTSLPLPVELLYFKATYKKNAVVLDWATASELNNLYFTIERSKDGSSFQPVLSVDGKGTNAHKSVYQTGDNNPLRGLSYYRLRQTDANGQFTFSKVLAITSSAANLFMIYPNPVQGSQFYIKTASQIKTLQLKIYDQHGSQVFSNYFMQVSWEVLVESFLKKGIYTVQCSSSNYYETFKLVILQ